MFGVFCFTTEYTEVWFFRLALGARKRRFKSCYSDRVEIWVEAPIGLDARTNSVNNTPSSMPCRLISRIPSFGLGDAGAEPAGATMKNKPTHWVSLKTGNKYPYKEYCNHGKGGIYRGYKDLPKDEYPYTLTYGV